MTSTPELLTFTVTPSSGVNGATNNYKITVSSPIPEYSTDKLTFTFPTEVTLPTTISCTAGTSLSAVSCTKSG